jgi:transcriptional regulator of acetoin/glycerol metabolism
MTPHLSHRSLRCDAAGLATSDEIQYGTTGDNVNVERLVRRLTVQNCKAAGLDYGKTDCHSARRIIKALLATEGNLTKAAKRLDIDRKTIQRAMPMLQDLLEMAMAVQDRLVKQRVDRKLGNKQQTGMKRLYG